MLQNWQPGDLRDVHADSMALTLRIAAKALFDAEVDEDVAEIGRAFNTIVEEISVRLRRPFRIPDAVPTPGNIRYVRGVHRINRLVTRIIRERREHGGDRGDLFRCCCRPATRTARRCRSANCRTRRSRCCSPATRPRPSRSPRRSTCWPSTPTSTPAGDGIARRPRRAGADRGRRAAASLYRAGGERVDAALSARVGLRRQAVANCEIGGYAIPEGTTILISPWVVHRDPRCFDDPDDFRPERWDGDLRGSCRASPTSRSAAARASASATAWR